MHWNCYMRFPINEVHQCNKSINVKTDVNWTLHALQEWPIEYLNISKESVDRIEFIFLSLTPPPPPLSIHPHPTPTNVTCLKRFIR